MCLLILPFERYPLSTWIPSFSSTSLARSSSSLDTPLLLHGHTVEDVRLLHRAPPMGDDDKLGIPRHPPQILGIPVDIDVVESRLDLV